MNTQLVNSANGNQFRNPCVVYPYKPSIGNPCSNNASDKAALNNQNNKPVNAAGNPVGNLCDNMQPAYPGMTGSPATQPAAGVANLVNSITNEILTTIDLILKDSFSAIRNLLHEFLSGISPDNPQQSPGTSATSSSSPQEADSSGMASSGEFLWKPVSDKDGKLAILLPSEISDSAKQVRILSADKSKLLATGKYAGVGNGERAHFRFDKPGSFFPNEVKVEILLENGVKQYVSIPKTSSRFSR